MTHIRRFSFYLLGSLASLLVLGCSSDAAPGDVQPGDPGFVRSAALDVQNISQHGIALSHNVGQNCMHCHQAHGPGKGRFTIAGTLRNPDGTPHANGTVYLTRTDPTSIESGAVIEAVATIAADELGNFYSTEKLPLPEEALHVIVERRDGGGRNFMPFPTISAACNVCHVGSNPAAVKD